MTDLAVLGLRFETEGAENATRQLDQVTQKSATAERATDALAGANRRSGSAIAQMVASIERGVRDLVAMGQAQLILAGHTNTATGATRQFAQAATQATAATSRYGASVADTGRAMSRVEPGARTMNRALTDTTRNMAIAQQAGLNMSRQFADVGVSLASGISPLMILIQQGPQIADGFAVAGAAGIGFRGIMASLYATMAPLIPLVLGLTVAAGAIAAPFAIGAQQINAENKNLIDGLGLTKDQLENVKNEGVTMGDVLTGVWRVTSKSLTDAFGPEIEAVRKFFAELYQGIVDGAVSALKGIVGGFTGGFAAIRATWASLPAALGDAAYSAANLVLRGVESMVNGGVTLLNGLIAKANAAADAIPGLDAFIPSLSPVAIAELANPFAGAMARVGADGGEAFAAGFERGAGRVQGFLDDVQREAVAAAGRRIRREAGDAEGGGGAGATAREAQEVVRFLTEANVQVRELNLRVPEMVSPFRLIADELRLIGDLTRNAGQGLADSFGRAGRAAGGITSALADYRSQLAEINLAEQEFRLSGTQADRERAAVQIQSYGDMANAAKSFFGEQTVAYKALQGVEMAYRALQFANAVKAMALDTTETGSSIANSLARGAAKAAEAVAGIFAKLGPFGFPVAAAAIAVMASVGLKALGGGGGGGAAPVMPTTNTGTGTVSGDSGAESASIGNSLDLAERYWNRDLDLSNRMVASLRAIESNIGSVANSIARQMGVGGALDASGLVKGPTTSGGFLGIGSTTRSSELAGQGLILNGGQLADLIARGVSGSVYQLIENTKTKSGFLGFGGGTTTWLTETRTPLDQQLGQELGRVLASLRSGVLEAAGQLGVEGAAATLDALTISLGRIDFAGLSSSEVTERLNAVFSAAGDQMAAAILPSLAQYQRAGEGMLETLSRLATEFRAVDATLAGIGMTFGSVGLASLEARTRLVELSGGLDAFIEGADFFAEAFLTDAQRIAPVQAAVTAELARLGVAADVSRTGFADLVMGLDVSTSAGAEMFAALMRLAPALDQVLTYQEEIGGVIATNTDLERQRRELEIRLMEAQGRISESLAARRADELAAIDATLRPMQEAVWAAQDMAQAANELAAAEQQAADAQRALASQRRDLEIQLMEAQGNAAGALAARRDLEIAALDATLRPLQLAIYAALDLAAANDVLAQAQADATAAAEQASQAAQALADQRRGLEIDLLDAQGDATAALTARRQLELEALDASLRPLQLAIFAAQDLAAANETLASAQAQAAQAAEVEAGRIAQLAATRRSLEIDLLDAQGRSAEAVAARRTLELEALDASLRPLQEAIFAALDLAAAAEALANAERLATEAAQAETERLAQLASQRRGLEIELLQATGDAAGALAARRQDELAALDASLRPMQEAIYAAIDLAQATQTLANQQAEAAAMAEREAERVAGIARQQRGLDIALLDATGDSVAALAARRADELAALDASLRATQLAIYAAQDLANANEAAAQAQREAADVAARLADQRRSLEIGLMEATGNAAAALAARRQDELAALDASLRPIQLQIYAAQDLASAQERAAERQANAARKAEEAARAYEERRQAAIQLVDDARSNLSSAYEREAGALRSTIDTFRDFGSSIREFRRNLDANGPGSTSYASTRAVFEQTAALAKLGNADALGGLTGASQAFLEAALANASSATAYQRDLSLVKAGLDAAAATTDRTASIAEEQLSALDASVSGLLTLNESVLSVRDAISALQLATTGARRLGVTQFADGGVFTSPTMFRMGSGLGEMAEAGPEAIMPLVSGPNGLGVRAQTDGDLRAELRALREEVAGLRADQRAGHAAIASNTGQTAREVRRWTDDGLYVRGEDPDTPLEVSVAA